MLVLNETIQTFWISCNSPIGRIPALLYSLVRLKVGTDPSRAWNGSHLQDLQGSYSTCGTRLGTSLPFSRHWMTGQVFRRAHSTRSRTPWKSLALNGGSEYLETNSRIILKASHKMYGITISQMLKEPGTGRKEVATNLSFRTLN